MRVLLSGGGTAGHINPALSIAAQIKKEYPSSEIAFVGTPKGMENNLVQRAGYPIYHVDVRGFVRKLDPKSLLKNVGTAYLALTSPMKAKKILREFKPDIVIGTGGYVSWPVLRAAVSEKIPTAIHEQNAVVGVTTKMLSKIVDRVMISFEESRENLDCPKEKIILVGNPTNLDIKENEKREENKLPYLLSYGGSLGAKVINNNIFDLIESGTFKGRITHSHAVGKYEWQTRKEEIEKRGIDKAEGVDLTEYIYDMPVKMRRADLVISRAGAITLAELAILGKPAILIPSPNVTNNHQYKNAAVVRDAGGAVLIEEKDLTCKLLCDKIEELIFDKKKLEKMSAAMKSLAIYDSGDRILSVIKTLLENKK
ncbi:MAG: undecaprenyldiphospho-muramoylpentapeptide beta-N-acetylglucosaminyltransferase [Ruminococcaceae bacterium]|nr:undecaprenyldiphospho-muramoylpentapeptide beta-N-acetylglucosaminyltransferase [Oscillospiraceae bacterium]